MNWELPDVQAGFRKGRGTRDQIANIRWIIKKAREFQKNVYFSFLEYAKDFDCVSSIQSLSHVLLFATSWTTACQASLSITNSCSLPKLMSIELVMPSNHLILCRPLCLLPSIFPNIRLFSNESALRIRWPKYWIFSFNISPSNEYSGLISYGLVGSPCSPKDSQESSPNTTVQKHQFFCAQLSLPDRKYKIIINWIFVILVQCCVQSKGSKRLHILMWGQKCRIFLIRASKLKRESNLGY